MGKELDPRIHLQHSLWQFSNLNCVNNLQQPNMRPQNTNLMLFPTYVNPNGCVFSTDVTTTFPGICPNKPHQQTSALIPPLFTFPSHKPSEFDGSEKRFVVFDQSRDGKSFVFSLSGNPFPYFNFKNSRFSLRDGTQTNIVDGRGGEEMHENTEEIDALLYSDSDEDHGDEEASTGHSPVGAVEKSSSEVASSMHPAKRRRVDVDEFNASLVDTASSAVLHQPDITTVHRNKEEDDDADSSCVKGGYQDTGDKRFKRARIRQTIGILRRIIPGGKGKDAVTILDEAIHCLKSLK